MPTGDALRKREAEFAARAARLLNLDPARVHVENVSVEEPYGGRPILRLQLLAPITNEEAFRLRWGDDAEITQTADGGWSVTVPTPDNEGGSRA